MRHKWTNKGAYHECKCGCIKQKYYGLWLYFMPDIRDPFLKAPKCLILKTNQT